MYSVGYLGCSKDFYKAGHSPLCFFYCTAFAKPTQTSFSDRSSPLELPSGSVSSFPFMRTASIFYMGTIYSLLIVLSCSVLLNADYSPKPPFLLHFPSYPDFIGTWNNMPGEVQPPFEQSFHFSLLLMDM